MIQITKYIKTGQGELTTEVSQVGFCGKLLRRPANSLLRPREYLVPNEVEKLLVAAKKSPRNAHRNYCLVLLMYRHGLRVSEVCSLQWHQVDFKEATLHVQRLKKGKHASHPIPGIELRALRQLQREYPDSPFLFISERNAPLSRFSINELIKELGKKAKIDFPVHAHMLRHACGYYLINEGIDLRVIQDYLGHKTLQATSIYTELAPGRFRGIWND